MDESGAVYTYEFRDSMITLTETTGDTMVFTKTDAAPSGGSGQENVSQKAEEQTPFQEYWNGD